MKMAKLQGPLASAISRTLGSAGGQLRPAVLCLSSERTLSAKSGAEGGFLQIYGRAAGAVVLMAATGGVAASAFDDVLIYKRCSSKALEKATQDPRLIEALGESIKPGAWYEVSLGVARNRHSASCSFPISGTQGSGRLHLKAVRVEGGRSTLLYNVLGSGRWDVLMLEALVPQSDSAGDKRVLRRINLMQPDDTPKTGDKRVQGEGEGHNPCQKSAVQEV